MCDYSLQNLASRPAKVGDRLITTRFDGSYTTGFCAVDEPNVAVCVVPGTELAFGRDIEYLAKIALLPPRRLGSKVARFCRVNEGKQYVHHDALEVPSGEVVLLTRLRVGQEATILQLPAEKGLQGRVAAPDRQELTAAHTR
jgi:hypothetical protein